MKTLAEQMAVYARYHRDPRNRLTHYLGVPLITFAILIPMGWLRFRLAGAEATGAMVFVVAVLVYYFLLDQALAVGMAIISGVLLALAEQAARLPLAESASVFLIAFVFGWVLQLIGHGFEGRRPALVDNLLQVLIAPIFLLAEAYFLVGAKRALRDEVATRMRSVK